MVFSEATAEGRAMLKARAQCAPWPVVLGHLEKLKSLNLGK